MYCNLKKKYRYITTFKISGSLILPVFCEQQIAFCWTQSVIGPITTFSSETCPRIIKDLREVWVSAQYSCNVLLLLIRNNYMYVCKDPQQTFFPITAKLSGLVLFFPPGHANAIPIVHNYSFSHARQVIITAAAALRRKTLGRGGRVLRHADQDDCNISSSNT